MERLVSVQEERATWRPKTLRSPHRTWRPGGRGVVLRRIVSTAGGMSDLRDQAAGLGHPDFQRRPAGVVPMDPRAGEIDLGLRRGGSVAFEAKRPMLRVKRTMDVVIALVISVVALPLLAAIALALLAFSGRPLLHVAARPGIGGRPFRMLKFRTMVRNADDVLAYHLANDACLAEEWAQYQKLHADPRVSLFGRFLRRTSLDELPQLWNVLRGDMSIVGPRPPIGTAESVFGTHAALVTSMKPGLTGLWAVSGRQETGIAERVRLEAEYVANWSLVLDLVILGRTVPAVLSGRGAV